MTVVNRMVQQTINQVLTIIYDLQFFSFRPRSGCLNAQREVQKTVDESYRSVNMKVGDKHL